MKGAGVWRCDKSPIVQSRPATRSWARSTLLCGRARKRSRIPSWSRISMVDGWTVSPRKSRKKSACFSSTRTRQPARANSRPAIIPAGPPPTTIRSRSASFFADAMTSCRRAGEWPSTLAKRTRLMRSPLALAHQCRIGDTGPVTCSKARMEADFRTSGFSDALVILGAAGLVIPAFARIRISPIIGFILIGMIVGPAGLGAFADRYSWLHYVTISNSHRVGPFAELGIVLLLFSVGLELSFRRVWSMRRLVFGAGAAELIGCAAVIGGGLYLLGQSVSGSVALGLALALSSTALVIPLVGTHTPVGRSALGMLLFEDLALVPIVFALGAMAPGASGDNVGSLLGTLAIGGITTIAMLFLGRLLLPHLFAQAARTKNPELFLAACLLVVIIASMVTSAIGFSPVLGALIAGIVIAETEYRGEVEVITAPFRGLGLGIFLITVGMSVDFQILLGNWRGLLGAL